VSADQDDIGWRHIKTLTLERRWQLRLLVECFLFEDELVPELETRH
jgi:hypothetical protein